MNYLRMDYIDNSGKDDILSEVRKSVMYKFGIVCIILGIPIVVNNFFTGQILSGTAVLTLLIMLALNSYAVHLKKFTKLTLALFFVMLMTVIGISLLERGMIGLFWAYPAILFFSFVVSQKLATIYVSILSVYISVFIFYLFDIEIALRATIALIVTIVFTRIFLNAIYRLREKLIEQSNLDPLTGAFNRRVLDDRLEEAIERKRRTNTPASVIIVDIDHFKEINDNFGHAIGDKVLIDFVALLKKRLRRIDQLYRIGGEEFLIFTPDTTKTGAITLANEILALVSKTVFAKDYQITVSIGVSTLENDEKIEAWTKRADKHLYFAKENGRNQVCSKLPN